MNDVQLTRYKDQEIRELKAENTALRKRLGEKSRHARRVARAYQDALLLATWRAAHIPPSRSYAAHHKISQRRWENAIGLLRLARVITGHRRWVTTDLSLVEARLSVARQRAIDSPDTFKARLNGHANHE